MTATDPQRTILLVDDDEDFRLQTSSVLGAAGFKVVAAESLKEADGLLAELRPDLVVADLMMEYPDAGFVLCHHVKKKDAAIPVILVTNVTSESRMEFGAVTGDERSWIKADAILAKPVRGEQLRREIARLLPNGA